MTVGISTGSLLRKIDDYRASIGSTAAECDLIAEWNCDSVHDQVHFSDRLLIRRSRVRAMVRAYGD